MMSLSHRPPPGSACTSACVVPAVHARTAIGPPVFTAMHFLWASSLHARTMKVLQAALLWGALLFAPTVHAQTWSEDPSDATTSLNGTIAYALVPGEPATCGANSSTCNSGADFDFGNVSSSSAQTTGLAYPPCQVEQTITPTMPNKDIWFRLDPAFADAVYRFTLYGAGAPAMTQGGMAVYEAPNSGGPFRLLDCALRGGPTSSNNLPSVEATCITAGNKLYIRVWDRSTPVVSNSKFSIGVMGQRTSTLADRGADETPCTARTIAAVGSFSTAGHTIDYVFTCDESGFLYTTPEKAGGDLWVKLVVPASGNVRIKPSNSTSSGNMIGGTNPGATVADAMGISAYLASDCSDYGTFKEVGSTTSNLTPGSAPSGYLDIKCLPVGATLYVRIYALKEAATGLKIKRFGQMRLEWMASAGSGTPPANCDPCSAPSVTVSTNTWGSACVAPVTGSTYMSCQTPGMPAPECGGFSTSLGSVWYKFVAPVSGMVVIDAAAGGAPATQPAIALYTTNDTAGTPGDGCNQRMNVVSCDDRQGLGPNARIVQSGLRPGQIYYVRVWARNGGADGNFTLCISSPPPPAGSCWYMIDLYAMASSGTLAMEATVPPSPMVTYTTTGGDPSETFLVAVPAGGTADFHLVPTGPGIGATGYIFWGLWQLDGSDTLWYSDGGYAVAGPTAGPADNYHLSNACMPRPRPRTDCFGMRTICLDASGPTHQVTGQMDTRGWPIRAYSNSKDAYKGYTFHPNRGGLYDLAGDNLGCLDKESMGIQWMVFHPDADGTVAFVLEGFKVFPAPTVKADLDFAVWDLGVLNYQGTVPDSLNGDLLCPPKTAPIRCSSGRARLTTGMAPGITTVEEGHGGWGWVEPLPVQTGHGYLIAMTTPLDTGRINYSLNWTLFKNALGTTDPSIISCDPLLLPVELLFLAGVANGNQVDLTWATATEKNSSHFIVERSTDNLDFVPIGRVAAAGNSQFRIDYAFTDPRPMGGVNYYRLRLVDRDGSTDVSNTIAVMFTGDGTEVVAWPNPAQDQLNLSFGRWDERVLVVRVVDATGRLVMEHRSATTSNEGAISLKTGTLAPGAYVVQITGAAGNLVGSARFVKD